MLIKKALNQMDKANMTTEQKIHLKRERQRAVREAWGKEKISVANSEGTRDWDPKQQQEIMERGSVEGYEGHHMKSVSSYPEHAGNPDNIQFLAAKEHFEGAHQGNFHNQTNGYYNPDTGVMEGFNGAELKPVEKRKLSEPCYDNGERVETAQFVSAFNSSAKGTDQESNKRANDFNASAKQSETARSEMTSQSSSQSTGMSK